MYAIPAHLYHVATHSRLGEGVDQIGRIGGLVLNALIGAMLLLYAYRTRSQAPAR